MYEPEPVLTRCPACVRRHRGTAPHRMVGDRRQVATRNNRSLTISAHALSRIWVGYRARAVGGSSTRRLLLVFPIGGEEKSCDWADT